MNYYNPFFNVFPSQLANNSSRSLFGSLTRKSFSWSNLISGAQKTLNLINQAIPVIKQASPIVKNAKTMFKVMNEFKRFDISSVNKDKTVNNSSNDIEENRAVNNTTIINDSTPTFFV